MKKQILLILLMGWLCPLTAAHAQNRAQVMVFAAVSMKEALDDLAKFYTAQGGVKVVVAYAASSALARQIERGAPADVFISADLEWMDYLAARNLVRVESRVNLVSNRLVLIAPAGSKTVLAIVPKFPLFAALGTGRLALADPASVPAGKYAQEALKALNVWDGISSRTARAENVRAALVLVARGEAPLGIVYATDAIAERRVRVVGEFPMHLHPPIVYPAAIIENSKADAAAPLLHYLHSPQARAVWRRHGFTVEG